MKEYFFINYKFNNEDQHFIILFKNVFFKTLDSFYILSLFKNLLLPCTALLKIRKKDHKSFKKLAKLFFNFLKQKKRFV